MQFPVWAPSGKTLQDEFEKVQNRAARFVTENYNFETGSMTDAYRHSFFPETIRDWNALPASTVSSAECSGDCIPRFYIIDEI